MADAIRRVADGASLLNAWLGEGAPPVSAFLAENRAAVCTTCEYNKPGRWWNKALGATAKVVRATINLKREAKLETPLDDQLGNCTACDCCLVLKVWVPIDTIKEHMNAKTKRRLPPWCWVLIEL